MTNNILPRSTAAKAAWSFTEKEKKVASKLRGKKKIAVLILLSLCCLLSCGLEAFLYIDYIDPLSVAYTDVDSVIRLPSSSADGYSSYFENFIIFYRIYTSGELISVRIEEDNSAVRREINETLNTDFNYLRPFTDTTSTTVNTANLINTFTGRGYYELALANENIDSVLSRNALNRQLRISFPTTGMPALTLSDANNINTVVAGPYVLQRTKDLQQPLPDRSFQNSEKLYASENLTKELNADVAANSKTSPEVRYTYVSLYIAAVGRDFLTYTYSQPTFLGIFRLPETN